MTPAIDPRNFAPALRIVLSLVAYDGSQFYRIFACASDAFDHEKLDAAMLRDSEARLRRVRAVD